MADVFPVTSGDYDELSIFLSGFEGETRGPDFWRARLRFWWEENPAFSSDLERGWLLREDRSVVGFLGRIPSYFQLQGEKVRVFNVTTWRVHPSHRNHSLKLLFELLRSCDSSLLFDTTPDEKVAEILKRSGFRGIPGGPGGTSYLVINFDKVLESKLGGGLLQRSLARCLAPVLKAIQSFRSKSLNDSELENVKRVMKADDSFDQLWEKTRNRYPHTSVRTADVLNWYCFGNEDFRKELFGYYKGHQLQGYALCWGRESRKLKVLECVDLWGSGGENKMIPALIQFVGRYAAENSFDLVRWPHFSTRWRNMFRKLGLMEARTGKGNRYFRTGRDLNHPITEENSYHVGWQGDYGL